MTKVFMEKVLFYGIVDTKKYRYRVHEDISRNELRIERLPIYMLDTTDAIDKWEIVTIIFPKHGGESR